MPSPIAHAVSGYAIAKGLESPKVHRLWPLALYAIFVAIAADFDFIPQIMVGIDSHRGFTHSISFSVVFSLVLSRLASRRIALNYIKIFGLTLIIYCSHLVLDFFTQGGSGIPLLWPISNHTFQSAISIFPAVHHSHGLYDSIHLRFLGFELSYTVILLWSLSQWKTFKHQRHKNISSFEP